MGKMVKVAQTADLNPGEAMTVDAQGTPIALFNVGGAFHAIHNTCLHRGGPLGEGSLDDKVVTCPWHGWKYDVTTGGCKTSPAAKIQVFPVKVQGSDLFVELP